MLHFHRLKNKNNSLIRVQKSNQYIAGGYRNLFLDFKREAVQFLKAKNLAVNYLPLQTRPQDRGHVTSSGLPLTMKNLMLKISNDCGMHRRERFSQRQSERGQHGYPPPPLFRRVYKQKFASLPTPRLSFGIFTTKKNFAVCSCRKRKVLTQHQTASYNNIKWQSGKIFTNMQMVSGMDC